MISVNTKTPQFATENGVSKLQTKHISQTLSLIRKNFET